MADQNPNNQQAVQSPEEAIPPMPVDLRSILVGVEAKLNKERELLMAALNDPAQIRNFIAFNNLVRGMQASIRTLDTMTGKTDLLGQPIKRQTVNVEPAAVPQQAAAEPKAVKPKKAKNKTQPVPVVAEAPDDLNGKHL